MFHEKRMNYHPLVVLLGIFLFSIAIFFTQSCILLEFILLLNLWKSVKLKSNLLRKVTYWGLFMIVINIFCGKLFFFRKICTITGYFLLIDFSSFWQVVTYCYEVIFYPHKSKKGMLVYLTLRYFPSFFKESYQEIHTCFSSVDFLIKKGQFVYKFRQSFFLTKEKMKKIELTYCLRLYGYGKKRTCFQTKQWSREDNTYFFKHVGFLIVMIILGRYL